MAGVCMVLAGGFGVLATLMGLRLLYRADESLRSQTTTALLFLSGEQTEGGSGGSSGLGSEAGTRGLTNGGSDHWRR